VADAAGGDQLDERGVERAAALVGVLLHRLRQSLGLATP
jgi:hypothetical protein